MPPAVRSEYFDSRKSALVSLIRLYLSKKGLSKHLLHGWRSEVSRGGDLGSRSILIFEVQETEGEDEGLFCARAMSMYQHGLRASLFAKRATMVQHRR